MEMPTFIFTDLRSDVKENGFANSDKRGLNVFVSIRIFTVIEE